LIFSVLGATYDSSSSFAGFLVRFAVGVFSVACFAAERLAVDPEADVRFAVVFFAVVFFAVGCFAAVFLAVAGFVAGRFAVDPSAGAPPPTSTGTRPGAFTCRGFRGVGSGSPSQRGRSPGASATGC
jgi:hypothetical protein